MYTVKWAVLQYVVIRPLVTITGIICQAFGVLCEAAGFKLNAIHFANIYLEAIDFVSISCVHSIFQIIIRLTLFCLTGSRYMVY